MKILIYGSNGWIGKQVIQYLESEQIFFIKGISRVDNLDDIKNEIQKNEPTHVLSLIGRTHGKIGDKIYSTIDYLEQENKLVENLNDNLFAPVQLALICNSLNIHFTYLGTGCIFEYDEPKKLKKFDEISLPNFFGSSYSIVKGFTDRLMHIIPILNLRIRMPINSEYNSRNFITKITHYDKVCSIQNSMTVIPSFLPYIIDMMKQKLRITINLTNPGTISHNEILQLYTEIVDPHFVWDNFTIDEQNSILSSKRSNNHLDTTLLKSLYPDIKHIKEAVIDCLQLYPKNIIIRLDNVALAELSGSLTRIGSQETKERNAEEQSSEELPRLFTKEASNTTHNIIEQVQTYFLNDLTTNILITGGCGFIGSHFINHLYDTYDKINIINIDALYYCANEKNIRSDIIQSKRYKMIKGNICSDDIVRHVLNQFNINYVVHFAAQTHVQNSFSDAIQYTIDNIVGTHTLLESCRNHGKIIRFIHVSTDEVYGESLQNIDEKHKTEFSVLCPTNPYAGTKAGAELIAQTYYHSFQMPIIITRGNNVYGPNQYPEKLIPKFIQQLKSDKKVTIQGNGSALRGFLHISDTVNAFDIILSSGQVGQIYNIGCDSYMEYSVLDVAKILIKLIKNTVRYENWIKYIEDRPFNDSRYYISNQKLKDLGWGIKTKFMDGLKQLVYEL